MQLLNFLYLLASVQPILATSLINFSAAAGDNPSTLGILDLEEARGDKISSNIADLYAKLGTDSKGTAALHYHRKEGYIRAEYHALSNKLEDDKTYYIGYKFSLGVIEESLMIFQFKAYEGNDATTGGANIPLSLEFKSGQLHFQYQADYSAQREPQWSKTLDTDTVYSAGIVIHTGKPGWVEFYFDGEQQTFSTSKSTKLVANTWDGRNEPKFGAYRGEAVEINTYVYNVQIGTELSDIEEAAGLTSSAGGSTSTTSATSSAASVTATCSWEGHCAGASCETYNDCSDDLVCTDGACASP
ncbi:hypothetical protein BO70DRAFT_361494 [Aspergillus heteromorphus CBS 117.55]|uniref:Concanavalin A-like lectin/glucanase n=1 Tax=Aspergillus heteromorphus CBS 117.55 TaxID=1448321 RepID=A0A317WEC8_9EURO|nr:uncharacterized protein BO70DRAFT_361494 [Aspergillus heteromorphus CBS 117.55]PWY83378.1 hypothetical protein BO70DRAFT_361494 [Aspergillus heteromorphus CBS 117.55]